MGREVMGRSIVQQQKRIGAFVFTHVGKQRLNPKPISYPMALMILINGTNSTHVILLIRDSNSSSVSGNL
jgi:hypothetical protein